MGHVRNAYSYTFISKLRDAVKFASTNQKDANFNEPHWVDVVEKICERFFTNISLEGECFELVDKLDAMGKASIHTNGKAIAYHETAQHEELPLIKRLRSLYKHIEAVPYSAKAPLLNQWANSARGQWNKWFDPFKQGNPVHVIYELNIQKPFKNATTIKALGFGSPTNEGLYSAAINDEFKGFLRSYKKAGKSHLYVSNQSLIPKTGWKAWLGGDETARSNEILNLQKDPEVKGAFFAIALSKNSPFYYQKGKEFEDMNNSVQFKSTLLGQIFDVPKEKSGNFISNEVLEKIPDLKQRCETMIQEIHQTLFDQRDTLTRESVKTLLKCFMIISSRGLLLI